MQNICHQCQHINLAENRYCTRCGVRLETPGQIYAQLFILDGQSDSIRIDLTEKRNFIGREKSNSIVLEDEKVSKRHAVIYQRNGSYYIEDLKSKNGVFINGEKIEKEAILKQGVLVKIGSTFFRFEFARRSQINSR